ncbi:urease subunit beta [Actinomadura luteofluorescens]
MSDDVYMYGEGDIELNVGQPRETILVQNTGDRAVQVGSHFHFFETNRALKFERDKAFGKRLDIPSGTAVRFEPGDTKEVTLVEYGGGLRLVGFGGLLNGSVRSEEAHRTALRRMHKRGYLDEPVEPPKKPSRKSKSARSGKKG